MSTKLTTFIAVLTVSSSMNCFANTKNDHHVPIQHCYHWLNEGSQKHLTYKYNFANKNDGEMTFYTDPATSNGAVAGPGLYCGKTPGDSYSYGDRVIRVDFVDDVVMLDSVSGTQYCGHKGDYYKDQSECQRKPWDVKFYSGGGKGNYAWYVIRNPQAVFSWSATSDQLINDLNAEKSYEPAAYAIHADNTIKWMRAEAVTRGASPIANNNARLSILKILQDPAKLSQMPPLTVIALVQNFKGPELSGADKKKIYTAQFERAFKDTKLTFADMSATIKLSSDVENSFLVELRKIPMNQLDQVNPVLVLQGLDKYETTANLSEAKVKALWQASLLSANDLQSLVDTQLSDQGVFATSLEASLPSLDVLKTKSASYNLVPILKILNKYVTNGSSPSVKGIFKSFLKELVIKKGTEFVDTYDKLDNVLLDKETVLTSIVTVDLMGPAVLTTANPIFLGVALDKIANKVSAADLKKHQAKILKLPLIVDSVPTYQIIDDLENKKFSLPSFYPEQNFLLKLVSRSLEEQKISKTPTNTFRMVMSGFFSFYNEPIRNAKGDAAKSAASLKAADAFFNLAQAMNTEELIPYRYITLQNSSYFRGKSRSKDHPIEHEIANYKQGNAAFDKFLEETIATSYDGSVMQYLIFQGKTDLLKMAVDHLLSKDFNLILSKPSFILSQTEKKSWANIISNKAYSPTDNNRAPSNVCHAVNVFKRYNKELGTALSTKDADNMSEWAKNMESGFCKRN